MELEWLSAARNCQRRDAEAQRTQSFNTTNNLLMLAVGAGRLPGTESLCASSAFSAPPRWQLTPDA